LIELLFVIPTQKRNVSEKLVRVVNVPSVVVYPYLKPLLSWKLHPDFKKELIGGDLFGLHYGNLLAQGVSLQDSCKSTKNGGQ
jgi:hypothetical protein